MSDIIGTRTHQMQFWKKSVECTVGAINVDDVLLVCSNVCRSVRGSVRAFVGVFVGWRVGCFDEHRDLEHAMLRWRCFRKLCCLCTQSGEGHRCGRNHMHKCPQSIMPMFWQLQFRRFQSIRGNS